MPRDPADEARPPVLDYGGAMVQPRWVKCVWLLGLYAVVAGVAIMVLEPGITPPGFTGRGFAAMGIIAAGAYHVGRYRYRWPVFFGYGCLAMMMLVPSYLDGRRGLELARDGQAIYRAAGMWMGAAIACGALTSVAGWMGARTGRESGGMGGV